MTEMTVVYLTYEACLEARYSRHAVFQGSKGCLCYFMYQTMEDESRALSNHLNGDLGI